MPDAISLAEKSVQEHLAARNVFARVCASVENVVDARLESWLDVVWKRFSCDKLCQWSLFSVLNFRSNAGCTKSLVYRKAYQWKNSLKVSD